MKKTLKILFAIFSIGIFVFGVYSVLSVFGIGRIDKSKQEKPQVEIPQIENKIGGAIKKLAPLNLSVKGELKNRQTIINKLREKNTNNEPLTMSFNENEISDVDEQSSLIGEHIARCGRIEKENYAGEWPISIQTIMDILEQPSC